MCFVYFINVPGDGNELEPGATNILGGLKEKLLAAHRAGIKKVLIPKDNEKDLTEIPKGPTKKILYRKLKEYYKRKF